MPASIDIGSEGLEGSDEALLAFVQLPTPHAGVDARSGPNSQSIKILTFTSAEPSRTVDATIW
ncbi:hypothetical protein BDZ89DRAFT_1063365 [Hymenopellis radicata]|nr:hypothetical protein BDZ89DRAFT_1063365 [Hymenopellis radicata]